MKQHLSPTEWSPRHKTSFPSTLHSFRISSPVIESEKGDRGSSGANIRIQYGAPASRSGTPSSTPADDRKPQVFFGKCLYETDKLIIQAHSNTTSMLQISIYVEIGKISLTFVTESFS
jgi:hypothetical protein